MHLYTYMLYILCMLFIIIAYKPIYIIYNACIVCVCKCMCRLDAVASAGFGLGRNKVINLMDSGQVLFNWKEAKKVYNVQVRWCGLLLLKTYS